MGEACKDLVGQLYLCINILSNHLLESSGLCNFFKKRGICFYSGDI